MTWGLRKPQPSGPRYVLGAEIAHPKTLVSIPRSAHLAVIGESNSGKGSVIAAIISQEVETDGEVRFIDLKSGMEAANYERVLTRKAYDMDEAEELLRDFNNAVDLRAAQWRGKSRSLDDGQAAHRLLVIDEAADLIRSGPGRKQSEVCVELVRSALSRSRALNCSVLVSTQNPRMSNSLPYRSLLLVTLAMRLNSRSEAIMALGEDAVRRGARPWQIRFNRPGDGYLWDSEKNMVRYLHVPFTTDKEIHDLRRNDDRGETERSISESSVSPQDDESDGLQGATTTPPWRDVGRGTVTQ